MIDNLFESVDYGDFDRPFDSIEGVAHFILHQDNTGPLYSTLRHVISCQAAGSQSPDWTATTIGCVRGMHEARLLMGISESPTVQTAIARRILNRAVTILRGES